MINFEQIIQLTPFTARRNCANSPICHHRLTRSLLIKATPVTNSTGEKPGENVAISDKGSLSRLLICLCVGYGPRSAPTADTSSWGSRAGVVRRRFDAHGHRLRYSWPILARPPALLSLAIMYSWITQISFSCSYLHSTYLG